MSQSNPYAYFYHLFLENLRSKNYSLLLHLNIIKHKNSNAMAILSVKIWRLDSRACVVFEANKGYSTLSPWIELTYHLGPNGKAW